MDKKEREKMFGTEQNVLFDLRYLDVYFSFCHWIENTHMFAWP